MDHLAHSSIENTNHKKWYKGFFLKKRMNLAVTEYTRHSENICEREGGKEVRKGRRNQRG